MRARCDRQALVLPVLARAQRLPADCRAVTLALRALAGLLLASLIALAAQRARALAPSGALVAMIVGTMAIAAGWSWGTMLVAFFVLSTLLTRFRAATKLQRTDSIIAKGGARDAWQVLANGGVYAVSAAGAALAPHPLWLALGAGALAAATADTWATEIGTLAPGRPRSIVGGHRVPPGTSGGVSTLGTMGAVAGSVVVGALAWALGWGTPIAAAAVAAGVAGSLADSLLGATVQARRWCARCSAATERIVHRCGDRTRFAGGVSWLDNDAVNLAATVVGALVCASLVAVSAS